jgi:hypothetical protein
LQDQPQASSGNKPKWAEHASLPAVRLHHSHHHTHSLQPRACLCCRSPFFLAFQQGLVQSKELAEAIFAFTDAIPGADILAAHQTVSLLSGSLISEVGMRVWPGLSGTVVTTSRISVGSPTRLDLQIESTRVAGSSFSPFIDNVAVPVEQIISQLRGEGAAAASYEVTYVDAQLRVTRAGDQLLLHRRAL